jgi:hypothetical protein
VGAKKSENAFGTGARHHRNLKQPILDPIAAVAGIAGNEQYLVGFEPRRCGMPEKVRKKMLGQV